MIYLLNSSEKHFKFTISIIGLFFIGLGSISAQSNLDENKRLSQFVLRSWNTDDGLTSESASEMVQTGDGYIWISTYTGLHRFDGKNFTVFNSQNSNIPSSNVLRIEIGKNNELWAGTLNGIVKYDNGEFTTPDIFEGAPNFNVEDLMITKSGDMWFSTKSNKLFLYDHQKLQEFTTEFGVNNSTILSIVEGNDGNIYFGTDDSQLIVYSDSGIRKIDLGSDANGINTLYADSQKIYLGTGRGLYILDNEEIEKSALLSSTTINTLIKDDQTLWIGTMRGLFRYQQATSTLDSLTEENGMPNNIVKDLLFDQQGNLWVGTYRSGIFFLSDGSITSFTENDGLSTNIISSVTEIEKDVFLLGNENGEINQLKGMDITSYKTPIPIPSERLKNLFTDNRGRVWISTYGGLVVLDGPNSKHFTTRNGFPDNFTRLTFQDSNGTIWVGTKNAGLILFDRSLEDWEQISISDGLSSNYILSIEEDKNGNIIVGTISGLNILEDRKVKKTVTVEDGLPSNFMFSTLSTDEFIWIASNDGLTGYNDSQIVNFNTENGMPSNIVYDVLEDENGHIWMPSENAILCVRKEDLLQAVNSPEKRIKVRQFDKSYGMKNSHCLGAVLSHTDSQGRFWIPTIGGIVCLNPDEVQTPNFNPKTIIENIYADNNRINLEDKVIIPARTNRLLIDFTGISYTQTDLLQFRYKLEPFDDHWVIASDDRNGLYTNLAPGKYEFQLQTGLDDSFTTPITYQTIIIEASWYQTIWAKVLMALAIIVIALFIYWMRTRSLTANNLKLESIVAQRTKALEEQKRELKGAIKQLKSAQEQMIQSDKMASLGILAAGVAHEINNPLNFIQGGVEGLEQTLKRSKKIKKEEYFELMRAIKEGISRASTIVLSLNEFSHSSDKKLEPCDIYHLIENCLTMIRYRLKNGIELIKDFTDGKVIVKGNNGKLHQALLNIITNSIQAIDKKGTITIRTTIENKFVSIEFIDSGHGIKPENLKKITEPFFSTKEPGKGTGLGLSITYAIINEHGGSLEYSSEWGKGTTAKVTLPLLKK